MWMKISYIRFNCTHHNFYLYIYTQTHVRTVHTLFQYCVPICFTFFLLVFLFRGLSSRFLFYSRLNRKVTIFLFVFIDWIDFGCNLKEQIKVHFWQWVVNYFDDFTVFLLHHIALWTAVKLQQNYKIFIDFLRISVFVWNFVVHSCFFCHLRNLVLSQYVIGFRFFYFIVYVCFFLLFCVYAFVLLFFKLLNRIKVINLQLRLNLKLKKQQIKSNERFYTP